MDSHPWFYDTFNSYIEHSLAGRLLVKCYKILDRVKSLSLLIDFAYGLLTSLVFNYSIRGDRHLFSLINKSEIFELERVIDEHDIKNYSKLTKTLWVFNLANFKFILSAFLLRKKIWSILSLNSKSNELCRLRCSQLIFIYIKLLPLIKERPSQKIIFATVSSPYALVLNAISNKLNLQSILFDHGYFINDHVCLKIKTVIFSSKFNKEIFLRIGNIITHSIVRPIKRQPLKFNKNLKPILLLPKIYNIEILTKSKKLDIEIRYHPQDLLVKKTNVKSLQEHLSQAQVAISGSSTVLVDAILEGIPAIYVAEVDIHEQEGYEFVKKGLFPRFSTLEDINYDEVEKFYLNEEWNKLFESLFQDLSTIDIFNQNLKQAIQ